MSEIQVEDIPLGSVFGELAKAYIGIFNRSLEHLPIKRYFYALVVIDEHEGELSQTTLGDTLYLDKASIVRMLDYLETAGCINRCTNPCDRRAHILELTDKAREMIPVIKEAIHKTNKICVNHMPNPDVNTLKKELNCIRENLLDEPKRDYKIHLVKNEDRDN